MKPRVIFAALIAVLAFAGWVASPLDAAAGVAFDGFESGDFSGGTGWADAEWSVSGDASVTQRDRPKNGEYHVRLRRNGSRIVREANVAGGTDRRLEFWAKARSFSDSDQANVLASVDGVSWTVVKTFTPADSDNVYRLYSLPLSDVAVSDRLLVAFEAELSRRKSRWYLDDVAVTGPNIPPVADAGPSQVGDEGSSLVFDGSASLDPDGLIASYAWDFGDGGTGSGQQSSHQYADDGTYVVALTVTDAVGDSGLATTTATVLNVAPTADAGGPYSAVIGSVATLAGAGLDPGADVLSYEWDFDYDAVTFDVDASGVDLTNPEATYGATGTFTVALRVTDDELAASNIATAELTVTEKLPVGLVVDSDTSSLSSPPNYGKPNQSRVWYNSAKARWDAIVPRNDGSSQGSDHYIVKDVDGAQLFTSVQVSDQDQDRPDVHWDDATQALYVLVSRSGTSTFARYDYEAATDSYVAAIESVPVSGIGHPDPNRPATLYTSPGGDVWAASMGVDALDVQHSADGGETWMPSATRLNSSTGLGVTAWTHFEDAGAVFVGLIAGENGETSAATNYYFYFIDESADPAASEDWVDDSANIPAGFGSEFSDDHVSAARDVAGNQYFAVKTERGGPTDPVIKLFKRTPTGTWSQHKVVEQGFSPEQTRPSVVIDEEHSEILVYTTDTGGGGGSVKQASLNDLSRLVDAPLVPIVSSAGKGFDDIVSPGHAVNSTTGIVVLAHNETDETVWYSQQAVVPPDTEPPTAPSDLVTANIAAFSVDLSWSSATDNVGVTGYNIYRDGVEVGSTGNTIYRDSGLDPNTGYSYQVTALDLRGNESPPSTVSAMTLEAPEISTNLVAAYGMEEGAGIVVGDSSGNGNDGLLVGANWNPNGQFGGAVDFVSGLDRVELGNLDVAGDGLTILAWFKADDFDIRDGRIVSKATGIAEQDHYWMLSTFTGPNLRFRLKTADGVTTTLVANAGTLEPGVWTHAAATYDGTTMVLYKDGALVGQIGKIGSVATNDQVPATIGNNPSLDRGFDGLIDEVKIFNRALTPSEIQTEMGTPVVP